MAKDPAFLFYSSDFLTGVSDLTFEERGQYITLMCLQHQKGRLSEKAIKIAVPNATADVIAKFEKDENGLFFNERLEVEAKKRAQHAEKQRQRAIKGWEKRKKNKNHGSATANATALPLENEDESVNTNKDKIVLEKSEKPFAEIWPTFDDFWEEYDKKVGDKRKLKKKWDKLPHATKEQIMAYLPNYKIAQPEKKYRKNPETFLNNNGWEDELIISNEKLNKDFKRLKTREQNSQGWGN